MNYCGKEAGVAAPSVNILTPTGFFQMLRAQGALTDRACRHFLAWALCKLASHLESHFLERAPESSGEGLGP